MTIAELIAALQTFPPDMKVVVEGYEAGYDDPKTLRIQRVVENGYDTRILGKYDDAEGDEGAGEAAVVIPRWEP